MVFSFNVKMNKNSAKTTDRKEIAERIEMRNKIQFGFCGECKIICNILTVLDNVKPSLLLF